ncbi:nicotinate phosphoribosyltransferase [Parendozoicomonas haliclonae]|uniref:Nicotinate phosphoribosyltransferase n=1 Tax=Parendozoicomonas haliclonae TaxID=1960125 RepID=A0A1X7AIR3_9GAMM|nr:nicotinate phosphoribosyltransferase [Parendozoicomonas haliclonae]SMA43782.1 Nicotinate phosphoribosyltransferase [Parendozoicomonas haliclonae]
MSYPIIRSLLDTDFYKLTMQQAIFHHYPTAVVDARFHCRSDVDLRPLADEVREQIDALAQLQLTQDEKSWLTGTGIFQGDYLDWLEQHRLDPSRVDVEITEQALEVNVQGSWLEVTLFEIYILAIVSELYGRRYQAGASLEQARDNLQVKIQWLQSQVDKAEGFHFVDFGTRRRFSGAWHRELLETLQQEVPEYIQGTSNILLAKELGLQPVGTMGHEWLQAHQALVDDLATSQRRALEVWFEEYKGKLGIALTDTISMSAFLKDFTGELAQRYIGMRHDSGEPIEWGERAVAHYEQLDIDPRSRNLVFSDGLDFTRAWEISHHFAGRINTSFGIGTWLTNDVGGKPLNMVLKLVSCNGQPVAKISDAPGKTMCLDTGYVENLKRIYGLI